MNRFAASTNFIKKRIIPLSVVIPTIGRDVLYECLSVIENWGSSPKEVIVVLPSDSSFSLKSYKSKLILKQFRSPKGQVNQRTFGFHKSTGEFVLQLDDDVLLHGEVIELMIDRLRQSNDLAIGPIWYAVSSRQPFFKAPTHRLTRAKDAVLARLLGSTGTFQSRMGRISSSGVPFPVDPTLMSNQTMEVEWLSGGCVLHRRSNLLLENYYPYRGRASHEDLFHSWKLRMRGIKLVVVKDAIVFTYIQNRNTSLSSVLRDLRIQKDFVELANLKKINFHFWVLYCVSVVLVKKLINFFLK